MANVQVNWAGPGLKLTGKSGSGFKVMLDHVMPDEEREGGGPSPMEFLLLGLAGCTMMDVVSVLKKKRQPFTALQIDVSAERAENHPRVYTKIHLDYIVTGQVKPVAVERAIELSQNTYCSAAAMLSKTAAITTSYQIKNPAQRIADLEARIADLRARLPKHTPPTAMMVELDDLEVELEEARAEAEQNE